MRYNFLHEHCTQYDQLLRTDVLANQMHHLRLQGKIEESKDVFNQFFVIGKMSSKSIITKLNIILQSLI